MLKRKIDSDDYRSVTDLYLLYELLERDYVNLLDYTSYKFNNIDLVGCNNLFMIKQICSECSIFKWAYDNKFVPIDSKFSWERESVSKQELMSFLERLLAMYSSSVRLVSLANNHMEEVKKRQFSCTPSSQDFKIVIDYEKYMPIIKSDVVREGLDDLKSKFIEWVGEDYIEREQIAYDILDVLSTVVVDSSDALSLKNLKEKIISYIMEHSDIPDFSKSFLYAQDNNINTTSKLEEGQEVLDDINDILSTVQFEIKDIDLLKKLESNIKSYIIENGMIPDKKALYDPANKCVDSNTVRILEKKI